MIDFQNEDVPRDLRYDNEDLFLDITYSNLKQIALNHS